MKAKLIKHILVKADEGKYFLFKEDENEFRTQLFHKLSKQNCDEIFGVVDVNSEVEDIVKTICPDDRGKDVIYGTGMAVGIQCFNKAMELNKDKVFTLEDIRKAYYVGYEDGKSGATFFQQLIQSLQQPTEIEVEFEMICPHPMDTYRCGLQYGCDGDGCNHPNQIPYLDSEGCLVLKRVI